MPGMSKYRIVNGVQVQVLHEIRIYQIHCLATKQFEAHDFLGSSKNIWSIAHGKIETTPFQVRAPSPPRGLETPIGPAEDAELGGHGYDSSDCTCHAYHLWKSSCLQWRSHRYHVAPMVKKLTKPCLVV